MRSRSEKRQRERRSEGLAESFGRKSRGRYVEGTHRPPTDRLISQQGQKRKPPPASAEGGFRLKKAGEAIRTPDIHVGNVTLYH